MSSSGAALYTLYPEIRAAEGLVDALRRCAAGRGLGLESLVDDLGGARISTDRGLVSIRLGAEKRVFFVGIHESGIEWAAGATASIDQACQAVAAWQGGTSLDDFLSSFPFMKSGDLAHGLEEGNVAEVQWQNLLNSKFPSACRPLLIELSAFAGLRSLFPEISYGDLRFTAPPPRRDARVLRVCGDGATYRVRESGPERREYVLHDIDEVVRRITGFFAPG